MHGSDPKFLEHISAFLGGFYLVLAIMNGVAALYLWRTNRGIRLFGTFTTAYLWAALALLYTIISSVAFGGMAGAFSQALLPEFAREGINRLMGPVTYTVGSLVIMSIVFVFRRFFVKPTVAWIILNLALFFMGLSMTDSDFAAIVQKPDNVPIVGLIFLLGFFTWLGAYKAVINDDRLRRGLPPEEMEDSEKILVWPDLVYTELICMVALTALLLVWAICLKAPLEEPANPVKTPNPSKAPWYFLGLQEMLVYFDPWMAGVVLPSLIIFGLMAIPYLDFNKKGNGYYTIDERKFAYVMFNFGFIVLWVTLIVMGTFLRGPNWNFFGPYELWDPHKVEALNNVDLSEIFWVHLLNQPRPRAPDEATVWVKIGHILLREAPGILLLIGYLTVIPPAMVVVSKFFRDLYLKMGFLRYMILTNLLLMMMLLPVKMVCRWSFNLKYVIAIPEYLLNF